MMDSDAIWVGGQDSLEVTDCLDCWLDVTWEISSAGVKVSCMMVSCLMMMMMIMIIIIIITITITIIIITIITIIIIIIVIIVIIIIIIIIIMMMQIQLTDKRTYCPLFSSLHVSSARTIPRCKLV